MNYFEVLVYTITWCLIAQAAAAVKLKQRATNKDYARPGEFPYQVSIRYNRAHHCGGSLITQKHVLTAAHCLIYFKTDVVSLRSIKVAVGTTTVPGGIIHDVQHFAMHPHFFQPILRADVAVVRLATWVVESQTVRRISLPRPGFRLQPNQEFITSGFGASVAKGPTSPHLKKLAMSFIPKQDCVRAWGNYGRFFSSEAGLFCAMNRNGVGGLCEGDSGGPLTINKKIVVGITSSANTYVGCGGGTPDLFTDVSLYLNFINSEIAKY